MKITFLIPTYSGLAGGLRVVAQYADHLNRQGHSVRLISGDNTQSLGIRARLRRMLGRGRTSREATSQGTGHFDGLGLHVTLISPNRPIPEERFPDADVIVATWWQTVEWMTHLPPEKGVQVHFIQGHEVFPHLPVDRVKAVYRQPTRKIVVASWLGEVMQREYTQPSQIAPNGVDTAAFMAPERWPNKPLTVGFLYSKLPIKNAGLALEALHQARHLVPDLQAVVFGANPIDHPLPDWIRYELSPPQTRIPEIYASCDAWLFPSESEGFGLPILEAMACRTPVLATAAGAAPDLVTGANGRILPPEPKAFAQAIADMATMSEADWKAMSDAARRTAEANDITAAAERFEALLTAMI